jgi:glycine/D-amino acid oxidase-like deaminating enzyme
VTGLPRDTDVLVVGGGVAGVALVDQLAAEGVEVVLVERGELNREASGTNAGSMHLQIAIHQLTAFDTAQVADRLRDETRLAADAARLWHALDAELGGRLELHVTGGLMVAETEEQLRLLHDKQRIEQAAGLETHVLEGYELRRLAPYLAESVIGATACPLEGHVNPLVAVPLLARRAAERGAVIHTRAEVTAIEPQGAAGGAPFRVSTAAGTIVARRLVNAAGAWARELGELVGLQMPLRRMGLHVNVTEPRERLLTPLIQHIGRRLTLKQSANHTFIIGGGWPAQTEQPPRRYSTTWDSAAGNAAVAVSVVPALADVRVVRTWSGVMAWTDDISPIAGESRRVPGYHALVVGSSGYTLSPLLARRLAEHLTGSGPPLAPEYSPDRTAAAEPARI